MKRYFIILFASVLAFACNKDTVSYIDVPSINEGYEFGAEGGKRLGTIISNTDFEMVSDASWCKVIRYKENTTNNFRIDVEENLYAENRVATITISAAECEDRSIKVRQSAAEPILSVNQSFLVFDQNAASFPLEVTSNVNLKVSFPEWASLGEGVDIEMGRNTYTVYVEAMTEDYREGNIVLEATDYADMTAIVQIKQVAGDLVVFEDDFSWATGPVLCNSTKGEIRWDKCENVTRSDWSTTVYTGAGSADAPTPAAWTREGYIRMNYGKKPSNLVTPQLSKIEGTANLTVTFKACRYQTSSAPDGYHEIHVSCIGDGTVSTETFSIDNRNNLSEDAAAWYTLDDAVYTFDVTGATAETRIEFHFGPRRNASEYNTNLSDIPAGEDNCNCRMGFDDVKIIINKN